MPNNKDSEDLPTTRVVDSKNKKKAIFRRKGRWIHSLLRKLKRKRSKKIKASTPTTPTTTCTCNGGDNNNNAAADFDFDDYYADYDDIMEKKTASTYYSVSTQYTKSSRGTRNRKPSMRSTESPEEKVLRMVSSRKKLAKVCSELVSTNTSGDDNQHKIVVGFPSSGWNNYRFKTSSSISSLSSPFMDNQTTCVVTLNCDYCDV